VRVAPSMNAQDVANTVWALATLGWQAGEGAMRNALEAAAMRVAPSMNAQNVANTVWALATLGWPVGFELAASLQQRVEACVCNCGLLEFCASQLSQLLQAHLASQFLGLGLITLPSSMRAPGRGAGLQGRGAEGHCVEESTASRGVTAETRHIT
jgi:hypothetical protein